MFQDAVRKIYKELAKTAECEQENHLNFDFTTK